MRSTVTVVLLAGLFVLGVINISILKKEALLKDGTVVYLKLAPVDPRSLMQGDYMALRFEASSKIRAALKKQQTTEESNKRHMKSRDDLVVITVDSQSIGHFSRIADGKKLGEDENHLKFRIRNNQVKFATNAFFFQEGTAEQYTEATYGEFRVATDGDLLLTALRNKELQPLGQAKQN